MKIKKKILLSTLTAALLVSICAFGAGAVSTDKKFSIEDATLIQKNVVGMTTFDEKRLENVTHWMPLPHASQEQA